MPPAAHGAAVEPDGLVVEGVERDDEERSAVRRAEEQRPAGGRTVGEQEEAVEGRIGLAGQPELAVLEDDGPGPVGHAPGDPVGGREHRPADRRLVEGTGGEAREVGRGLGPEHQQRTVGVGADRAPDGLVDDHDLLGRPEVLSDRGGCGELADRRTGGGAGAEPVRLTPADADRPAVRHVDGQPVRSLEHDPGSLSPHDASVAWGGATGARPSRRRPRGLSRRHRWRARLHRADPPRAGAG